MRFTYDIGGIGYMLWNTIENDEQRQTERIDILCREVVVQLFMVLHFRCEVERSAHYSLRNHTVNVLGIGQLTTASEIGES